MDKLLLTPYSARTWQVVEDFTVKTSYGIFTVPKGMITDLASVPRCLWCILPPFGNYTIASVLHDYLYGSKIVSFSVADKVFKEVMLKYNTPKIQANIMYLSVRFFSGVIKKDFLYSIKKTNLKVVKKNVRRKLKK